ncbi:MAG TPA: hypothetical protein EYP88_03620 [Anaerolineales bacterium]|nr:hypothetical protein [Anaerolineales bacterium]
MTENPTPDISAQFRELGENFKNLLRETWEHEETRKLRAELQRGLDEFGKIVEETVDEIRHSETGQKIKAEAQEIKSSIERGEIETKAREDISKTLDFLNAELGKLNQKVKRSSDPAEESTSE